MKIEIVKKLIQTIKHSFIHDQIKSLAVCKNYLFKITFGSEEHVITINLQKPFMNLIYREQDDDLIAYPFKPLHMPQVCLPQILQDIFFDDTSCAIIFSFYEGSLVFPFKHKSLPYFESQQKTKPELKANQTLTSDDINEIERCKQKEKEFVLKDLFKSARKKQRRLKQFEERKLMLPKLSEKAEQRLLFILENQEGLKCKDQRIIHSAQDMGIDTRKSLGELIKTAYRVIRKLKRECEVLPNLIRYYETLKETASQAQTVQRSSEEKKQSREFKSLSHEIIKVAKSDKHADDLTFKKASGNFYWYHVDGFRGAHVIIFSKEPSDDAKKKAAYLAKYFSKAKDEHSVDVIESQVKFLKRGKKPGEVMISKKKVVRVNNDQTLFNQLFSPILL